MIEVDAMNAATREAQRLGIPQATNGIADEIASRFTATRDTLDSALWDPARGHYDFDTGTGNGPPHGDYDQGLFADATYPESTTALAGLPSIFKPEHLAEHLQSVYDHNVAPFKDAEGNLVGAVDLLSQDYSVIGDPHPVFFNSNANAREMWVGQEYPLAAAMVLTGRRVGDHKLVTEGLDLAQAVAYQGWTKPGTGYAFQIPEAQGLVLAPDGTTDGNAGAAPETTTTHPELHRNLSYGRPLAVWDFYDTVKPAG